jgi:hypothetical protein
MRETTNILWAVDGMFGDVEIENDVLLDCETEEDVEKEIQCAIDDDVQLNGPTGYARRGSDHVIEHWRRLKEKK